MNDSQIEAILDAAATVFAQSGYAGARVDAIAKAAGINKAMLYYRVGDKARLYELVILSHFDRVGRAVHAATGSPVPDANPAGPVAGSPGNPVNALLDALTGLFREDPRLPRIMAWEFASGGGTLPVSVADRWAGIMASFAPVALRAGMHPALMYLSLLGPLVLTCLTAPLRKRLGEARPELAVLAGFGVEDTAAFLKTLFDKATGEGSR